MIKNKDQTSGKLKSQVSDHKTQEAKRKRNYMIILLDTEMHLTKFFTNSWLKAKTKQISGTLKSQVSNHEKQKEITDLSLDTKSVSDTRFFTNAWF